MIRGQTNKQELHIFGGQDAASFLEESRTRYLSSSRMYKVAQ
jgi:hypothetical protein